MKLVDVDARRITDWNSFHDVFAELFGFPAFYGRSMNAWIDCMTYLDEPAAEMTSVHAPPGGVVVLQLDHVTDFARICPAQFEALLDCTALVNYHKIEQGEPAVLALSS